MLSTEQIGTIARLTDSIEAQLPGILHDIVRMAVWDAIEDFAVRSTYWREVVSWSLPINTPSVTLAPSDANAVIQQTLEVYGLRQYRIQPPATLVVTGSFAVAASGTALVVLKPLSLDVTPDLILRTWFETLRSGAMSRLYAEPSKPYSSVELATAFGGMFEAGIQRALQQANEQQAVGVSLFQAESIDRLYNNVVAEIPEVPRSLVQIIAWNAVEDFYIRSTWRRETMHWQMPAGVNQLDFNPFDGDWLVAWILEFTGLTNAKIEPPGLLKDLQWPISTSLRSGKVLVALKPTDFAAEFDPTIWQQWFDTILSGVLHRLYRQPAKSYSSPQLALYHGKNFAAGIASARGIASNSYTNGGGRRFPYFATGRQR